MLLLKKKYFNFNSVKVYFFPYCGNALVSGGNVTKICLPNHMINKERIISEVIV